jgi:DNA repair exonuclease SbcCD ATPase subunit|tara:strand:- start:34 stop:1743 length:1710 start_codon:yes stop_codon:yes gene_type:complete
MIRFEKIKYKNFLSTGNTFTEIDLNKSKSTLVIGHNGSGKSTMLDAISFALFGKPHRNITKTQLVNSINKKDTIVECELMINTAKFKIVRGISPNKFEIWRNGTMINQSSHAKEYQKILENNYLKLNHKSFHQVVVLGSSSFIPFMQLPGGHRRDVIEDLLDIKVFTQMNKLAKEKASALKERLNENHYNTEVIKNKVDTQKKYIRDVKVLTEQTTKSKQEKIVEYETDIKELNVTNGELSSDVSLNESGLEEELKSFHDKKQSLNTYFQQFRTQMGTITKDAKFYEENSECPTCSQEIIEEVREEKLKSAKDKAKELKSAMDRASLESTDVETNIGRLNSSFANLREKQKNIHSNNQEINRLQRQITSIETELTTNVTADLREAQKDLEGLSVQRDALLESKFEMNETQQYNSIILELLRDTGIKTKIIKQYLPVINKLINQYLQILDFFVHFDLDESFQETIRSRHRDWFTYDSFSEGEKQRIDLALLFTWRQVAKMKNSVSTNLLILDETFDSSLDHEGVDNLMKILYSLDEDSNVFVISHKGEILDGKFDEKIEFVKEKNFSKMK